MSSCRDVSKLLLRSNSRNNDGEKKERRDISSFFASSDSGMPTRPDENTFVVSFLKDGSVLELVEIKNGEAILALLQSSSTKKPCRKNQAH